MPKSVRITVPFAGEQGESLNEMLSIDDFLAISSPIIDRAVEPIQDALDKAGLRPQDIDMVLLAGGSSQLPKVSEKIEKMIGKRPRKIPQKLMLAVSYGAALYHRDMLNLPSLHRENRILGEDLGILVNDRGRITPKLLLTHNTILPNSSSFDFPLMNGQQRVTIRLVALDSMTNGIKYNLKQRDLVLTHAAASVRITISVTENRLIELAAFDPKHPENQSIIRVGESGLAGDSTSEYRKKLGITVENSYETADFEQCIGIDLGTTTSELSTADRSGEVAELEELRNPGLGRTGNRLSNCCFPSIVYFADGFNSVEVSNVAALSAKNDESADGKVFETFKTRPVDEVITQISGMDIHMQELSTYVLANIWSTAQKEYGVGLKSAVVTVPAAFSIDQCEATYNAAIAAGISHVTLIDEPTAAFYYYKYVQQINTDEIKNVLVFDFGGGTADIAILDVSSGNSQQLSVYKDDVFTVKAISGNPNCGGRDVDFALCNEMIRRFETSHHCKITEAGRNRLKGKVEEAKVALSEYYAENMDD